MTHEGKLRRRRDQDCNWHYDWNCDFVHEGWWGMLLYYYECTEHCTTITYKFKCEKGDLQARHIAYLSERQIREGECDFSRRVDGEVRLLDR